MGRNSGKKGKGSSDGIYKTLLIQFNTVLDTARRDFPGSKGTVYRCRSSMRQFYILGRGRFALHRNSCKIV
ncbi:hypothetical protein [Desulfolucanica intricata]|uniref:hypothetical protein n=1 Tax=Desulfolucanica intricata TaxID=1285191 RepID=UPI00082BFCD7|nr:hypothetical protein [Desulfolucanica intricata]